MPSPPKPEVAVIDGVTCVTFGPDFRNMTEDVLPIATDALLSAATAPTPKLVIDLGNTDFFGSSFIEILFRVWKRLKQRDGKFALYNLTPYCAEVIKITHLDTLWPVRATQSDAISAVRATA
jgi:anti-anti-sigma factor